MDSSFTLVLNRGHDLKSGSQRLDNHRPVNLGSLWKLSTDDHDLQNRKLQNYLNSAENHCTELKLEKHRRGAFKAAALSASLPY